ncbi:hypothetical protein H1W37_19355 [Stappia taiwanensis]|uniref:HTH cro/C1-type domain-containing protein n=1 Tax=Stappia taiwanensis TaxID=992267 RepID=A0A838XXM7_9HYPH|nr:hypothetical protein [Stappia taiwanensis]MBA4613821.1 hypothetical protein [Stappia taiwanensis]GGE79280.1 hypothetical protein GCM10007285_03870 [Stappia taiwanensis]
MTLSVRDIEARRQSQGWTLLQLCSASGVSLAHYGRLRGGEHAPRPATLSSLAIGLRRLCNGSANDAGQAFQLYRLAVVLVAQEAQADPMQVLAHDPSRRATSDPEWMTAAQVRRRALYIAHVCCGVSQADLARVSGMTAAAVSLAVNAIEDTRESDDDGSVISAIERVMQVET